MKTYHSLSSCLAALAVCALPLVGSPDGNDAATSNSSNEARVLTNQQTPAPAEAPATESPLVSGEISSVSEDKVVVEKPQTGEEASITLTEDTIIMVDGKSAESSDLKEGQQVIASTERQGSDVVAISLSARSVEERKTE